MKTTLTMVCTISAMCVVGAVQKPNARKTSISESELRGLATAAPMAKNAGQLYSVAMATTNNVGRRQELLKAAAACLIACGKNDVYKKHVKGKLQSAVEFENELKDDCKQCSGAGSKDRRCYECSGRGQCLRCNGSGQTTHVGFDRNNTVKTCSKCKGDGHCPKCGGEGSTKEKCLSCAGTGKAFSTVEATRVFRDSCNAIADTMKFAQESSIAKGDVSRKKNETKEVPVVENGKATGEFNVDAEKENFSVLELQALAKTIPDMGKGRELYSAALATTNDVNRQQKYLKAAAACLVACGKKDVYKQHVKSKLLNAAEFEPELKGDCTQCSGSGKREHRCSDCNGNGQCSRCTVGFKRNTATCGKCKDDGRCPKCRGKGCKTEKCMTCGGTGKVFSEVVATRVFRDSCNAIADDMKELARKREREKLRIEREKLRVKMAALGLEDVGGKWMTPGSVRLVRYIVYQIYEPGHALCKDGTGRVFCLLYSADDNINCAEGDVFVNDLYRCGTFSYTTVLNAPRTVPKFAIDLSAAQREIKKRNRD